MKLTPGYNLRKHKKVLFLANEQTLYKVYDYVICIILCHVIKSINKLGFKV
jgi:hypothetical protein